MVLFVPGRVESGEAASQMITAGDGAHGVVTVLMYELDGSFPS
jgi:hypothetical protein